MVDLVTEDLNRLFVSNDTGCDLPNGKLKTSGQLPNGFRGSFAAIGPSILKCANGQVLHPFDGSGALNVWSFLNGKIHYKREVVETETYKEDKEAGELVRRGFSTRKPFYKNLFPSSWKGRNPANTCVLDWNGSWLAMFEGGLPYKLDGKTLKTIEEFNFQGTLERLGVRSFNAHTRWDPKRGRLVGVSINQGPQTRLVFTEWKHDFTCTDAAELLLPHPATFHDLEITDNYFIVVDTELQINVMPFIKGNLGLHSVVRGLQPDATKHARIILLPRAPNSESEFTKLRKPEPIRVDSGLHMLVFHHANAYELDANTIVFHTSGVPSYGHFGNEFGYNEESNRFERDSLPNTPSKLEHLYEFQINISQRKVQKFKSFEKEFGLGNGFGQSDPERHGRPARFIYASAPNPSRTPGTVPLSVVNKLDVESGTVLSYEAPPRCVVSEPYFIHARTAIPGSTNEEEDCGFVCFIEFALLEGCNRLCLLDARTMTRIWSVDNIPHFPMTFHAFFTPNVYFSEGGAESVTRKDSFPLSRL